MKYKGRFYNQNLPLVDGKRLFVYLDDIEIIINYDKDEPFDVIQMAILLERNSIFTNYDVFECLIPAGTDKEAKAKAKVVAKQVIRCRILGIDFNDAINQNMIRENATE
jgi:hypothetical protein